MLKTLLLGLRLRCPNCGQGRMGQGMFNIHETCPVCHVRYERKPGESTGASIVMLSLSPIPAIILGFILLTLFPELSIWAVMGILAVFVLALTVLFYRNARGLWVAVVAMTDGLATDDEIAERERNPSEYMGE